MKVSLRERYFRQLIRRALRYKTLLTICVAMGVLNFAVVYIFPWLIGSAIDYVIAPQQHGGPVPDPAERMKWLFVLIGIGAGTAMTFAGLPREDQRANVVAFLGTLSHDPVPLPEPAPPAPAEDAGADGDDAAATPEGASDADDAGEPD